MCRRWRSICFRGGVRDTFIRSIVHINGPSVGFSPGAGRLLSDRNIGISIGSHVRLTIFYDLKYLQNDGSHIQTQVASQNGTRYWCYDTMKWGLSYCFVGAIMKQ